ncbi:MAG: class I SAM-dependent methyltransferase [Balneolaceae bacterium]|nr:MAG: class I SAM-dependent methyltransferase [Balneolaceae bacterium]
MNDLKFFAQQLRKPSGDFAGTIAEKMGEGNRPLYDLVMKSMQIKDHDSLLEIGFGSGTHFPDLLAKADGLRVAGIDHSPEMTKLAKTNNKQLIESEQLTLHTGNSNQLPFENSSFNAVFCNMVIYFWNDPVEHLNEIGRVLKPDGIFYTGMRTRESMLQFPFTKFGFNLYSIDEWKTVLQSHWFTVVRELRQIDPVFDDDGDRVQLESVCIAAVKRS